MGLTDQKFNNFQEWVDKAHIWLTAHPQYDEKLFRAICFDSAGWVCRMGWDFRRARNSGTFPVYWVWPDQNLFNVIDSIERENEILS